MFLCASLLIVLEVLMTWALVVDSRLAIPDSSNGARVGSGTADTATASSSTAIIIFLVAEGITLLEAGVYLLGSGAKPCLERGAVLLCQGQVGGEYDKVAVLRRSEPGLYRGNVGGRADAQGLGLHILQKSDGAVGKGDVGVEGRHIALERGDVGAGRRRALHRLRPLRRSKRRRAGGRLPAVLQREILLLQCLYVARARLLYRAVLLGYLHDVLQVGEQGVALRLRRLLVGGQEVARVAALAADAGEPVLQYPGHELVQERADYFVKTFGHVERVLAHAECFGKRVGDGRARRGYLGGAPGAVSR